MTLPLHTDQAGDDIRSIAFSPDGRRLASLGPGALAVRDATTGVKLMVARIPAGNLNGLAYSPDGRYVAACRQFVVNIWDMETAKEVRSVGHSGMAWSVAYSPDGQRLASASFDGSIKTWDTTSWNEIRTLRGHTDRVISVAFSPDGKRLASGSGDSTVKVWDAASGQELITFRGHTGYVWSVAFSPDSKRLASAGGHHNKGEVKVWDLASTLAAANQPGEGEKTRRQAIEFYEMLAAAQPKVWDHRRNLGHAYARQDQWEKAAVEYSKAVELNQAAWQEVIESLKTSGQLAEPDKAEAVRQRIIEMLEGRLAEQPKDRQARQQLAWALGEAANISQSPADRDLREQLLRRALALHAELASEPPGDPGHFEQTGHLFRYLGWLERDKGRLDEARQNFEKAVEVFKKLAPDDIPQRNGFYRDFEADTHLQLASVLAADGKHEAAEVAARQAADIFETLASQFPDHPDYPKKAADAQRVLADRLEAAGRHEESEKVYRRLISDYEKRAADFPDNREYRAGITRSYTNVIEVLLAQDKHAEAEETIRQAIDGFNKLAAAYPAEPDYHRSRAVFQRQLAQRQASDKRALEAEKSYLEAINSYQKIIAEFPQYEDLWRVYDGLAQALAASNRPIEADEARRKMVKLAPNNAGTLNNLAWGFATAADSTARNAGLAVELAKKGIELDPKDVQLPNTLGVAYYRAGSWQDAIEWLTKSMELRNGGDSFDWFFLAMAHWQLDHKDEARKWHAKAIEWMDANKPHDQQLFRFRTEAEDLIKEETPVPDPESGVKTEAKPSP